MRRAAAFENACRVMRAADSHADPASSRSSIYPHFRPNYTVLEAICYMPLLAGTRKVLAQGASGVGRVGKDSCHLSHGSKNPKPLYTLSPPP